MLDIIEHRFPSELLARQFYPISLKTNNIVPFRFPYSKTNFANLSFSDITKVWNAGLPMVRSQTDKSIFADKGNMVDKVLGHLFVT